MGRLIGLPATADLPQPRLDTLEPQASWDLRYDQKADVLLLWMGKPRAAISVDCDGQMWIRMHPVTGMVYGFEIEDFERVFLVAHPELASAWREVKGQLTRQFELKGWLNILFEFIQRCFAGHHPQQLSLSSGLS